MNSIYLLVTFILFTLPTQLYSQKEQIGLNLGSGKNNISTGQKGLINPFDKNLDNYYLIGLKYYYTHINSNFRVSTGINYEHRDHKIYNLDYLKVPLGIDIITKGKVQFILGAGLYLGYLISYEDFSEPDLRKDLNPWNAGVNANIGLGYQIDTEFAITLEYQQNYDLTHLYTDEFPTSNGKIVKQDYYGFDGYMKLGILYTFSVEGKY